MDTATKRAARSLAEYIAFVGMFLLLAIGLALLIFYLSRGEKAANTNEGNPAPIVRRTVILDAGHGGEDGGTIGHLDGKEIYEKDLNLAITLMVRDLLEAEGFDVVLTRETDTLLYDRNTEYKGRKKALDLAARLAIGQNTPNALFISIHMNAFPQKQYRGLQVYYSPNHPLSETLARTIQSTTAQTLQPDNTRQIKPADSNIYLLHRMNCPAVLVECGFLSNEEECRDLCRKEYQEELARLLFTCIRNTLTEQAESP